MVRVGKTRYNMVYDGQSRKEQWTQWWNSTLVHVSEKRCKCLVQYQKSKRNNFQKASLIIRSRLYTRIQEQPWNLRQPWRHCLCRITITKYTQSLSTIEQRAIDVCTQQRRCSDRVPELHTCMHEASDVCTQLAIWRYTRACVDSHVPSSSEPSSYLSRCLDSNRNTHCRINDL